MAAAAFVRSLARKLARAPPANHRPLLARGLHGLGSGASSLTQPPTMAAAAGHRLVHAQRGLHSLNSPNSGGASGSTPSTTSKVDFAKIRAGVAYVSLFGTLFYLYGSILPRIRRLEAIVEAQKQSKLDDALAIDAGPDTAQIMQSSAARAGHGKQHAGETGKTKYKDLNSNLAKIEQKYKDMHATIAKIEQKLKETDD